MADDEQVSQETINAVESEVNAKLAKEAEKTNAELAKKIREEVEKEFEQKRQMDKMQEDLKAAQETAKKATEEATKQVEALRGEFKKQLEEAMAHRKGTATNQSPFDNPVPGKTDISKLDMDEVERQTREAFIKHFGIENPMLGIPHKKID